MRPDLLGLVLFLIFRFVPASTVAGALKNSSLPLRSILITVAFLPAVLAAAAPPPVTHHGQRPERGERYEQRNVFVFFIDILPSPRHPRRRPFDRWELGEWAPLYRLTLPAVESVATGAP